MNLRPNYINLSDAWRNVYSELIIHLSEYLKKTKQSVEYLNGKNMIKPRLWIEIT